MADPYMSITSQPRELLAETVRLLELRGNESQQVRLRREILAGVSGRTLEVRKHYNLLSELSEIFWCFQIVNI